jgi:hypothetical protein
MKSAVWMSCIAVASTVGYAQLNAGESEAAVGQAMSQAAAAQGAAGLCQAGEQPLYTCTFGPGRGGARETVSVCASGERVAYRFGSGGRTQLEIASDGRDGRVHKSFIVGGGGGEQTSLRFSNSGYDYIVFAASYGEYTTRPGARSSGLIVERGERVLRRSLCPVNGAGQELASSGIPSGVPEDDESRVGWY